MSDVFQFARTAETAHARLDGHERLCTQNNEHTQKALGSLTEAIKTLAETVNCTNVRLHSRIDKLMYGMGALIISAAGGAIFMLLQFLWEATRYKVGG